MTWFNILKKDVLIRQPKENYRTSCCNEASKEFYYVLEELGANKDLLDGVKFTVQCDLLREMLEEYAMSSPQKNVFQNLLDNWDDCREELDTRPREAIREHHRRSNTLRENMYKADWKYNKELLDVDEHTYLYDFTRQQKMAWHRNKLKYYFELRDFPRGNRHRTWYEMMQGPTSSFIIVDMKGNILDRNLFTKAGRMKKVIPKALRPKKKTYRGPKNTTQELHDRFSSGGFTVEDMWEMHGKANYRRMLLDKLKEEEE